MVLILTVSIFSGCAQLKPEQVLSVRNRTTGQAISLGDNRKQVEKITGGDMNSEHTFTDENVQRVSYWDVPGLIVDFSSQMIESDGEIIADEKPEDQVVGIILSEEDKWEITGGIRFGMTKEKVAELLSGNNMQEPGVAGGILLSYDEQLQPITYDENSPYIVIISFEEDLVDVIKITNNMIYE